MNDLVAWAIDAHGGLDAWRSVESISANFNASGAGFKQRGPIAQAVAQCPMRATIHTREQQTRFAPFVSASQAGIYLPERTVIESSDGRIVEALDDPRQSLENMVPGTAWSATQVLYFVGYSLWMYLTLPYHFQMDGVTCEEIEPWIENGETWRALRVTYPPTFPSHSTVQIHYFDTEGRMRRQDYTVDVRQNLSATHYIDGHTTVDGLVFAKERRIYLRGADGKPVMDRLLISASFDHFEVTRGA